MGLYLYKWGDLLVLITDSHGHVSVENASSSLWSSPLWTGALDTPWDVWRWWSQRSSSKWCCCCCCCCLGLQWWWAMQHSTFGCWSDILLNIPKFLQVAVFEKEQPKMAIFNISLQGTWWFTSGCRWMFFPHQNSSWSSYGASPKRRHCDVACGWKFFMDRAQHSITWGRYLLYGCVWK